MNNIASLQQTPLLELRTEAGAVYLCPSRFQRMRLQWTFRHFRILPSQLLSRHDQRLIEKLCASAVVTPSRPVSTEAILGVVEKASKPAPLLAGSDRGDSISRWGRLGALMAATIAFAGLLIAARATLHRGPALPRAYAASQSQPAPARLLPMDPPSAPILAPRRRLAAAKTLSIGAPPAATAVPANTETIPAQTRWIAELPPGHFARPVVAGNAPAGEVQLNALIAPDGTVQQVTALSGDRKLAEAGMRAVRQWHYSPYALQGKPAIEETQIKMNFFGPDAVSISSVAAQP